MEKRFFLFCAQLVFFKCYLIACLAIPETNLTSDQSALLSFKTHINHDILSKNWTTTTSVCQWIGITCGSSHQRVTALNLPNMGLKGTISPHIGNLSFLAYFNISNNNFTGNLPVELVRLRRLKFIDFSHNSFSGDIPLFFSNMSTKLESINLSYNILKGGIPKQIGNLVNLKVLQMGVNQLSGSIPLSVFNISSLQLIDFAYNNLSGSLPDDMCYALPKIESLLLNWNELYGQIPSSIGECKRIQILALNGNKFTGLIPRGIGNLTSMKELYLGIDNKQGEIPQEIGKLSLETLAIVTTRLSSSIPSSIFNITSLKQLLIYNNNNLSGSLPTTMCSRLPLLEFLVLQNNKLTGSIPREISNCTSLKILYLNENNLTGEIPEDMGNLQHLQDLTLDLNSLTGPIPATIFNISTIGGISLTGNHLSGNLPSSTSFRLPNLKQLLLGENKLGGNILESISNSSKLTQLDLGYNRFTGSIPNSLGNLELLEIFSLAGNNFTGGSSTSDAQLSFLTSLTNCRHLRVMSILNNPLNGILPSSIGNLSNSLQQFDASYCGIKGNIPNEIGNLSNLAFLYLYGNDLSGFIPVTLKELQRLQLFDIQGNRIQGSIPTELCHLQNLGLLRLSANEFSGPVPACLDNATSLRYLYLDSNKLTSGIPISIWSLRDLLEFNLSTNSFSENLPPGLENLKVATLIDLSMNRFTGEIPSTIAGLQDLVNLSLAHNRLQGPIPESIGKLLSLELLDLSNNNLSGTIPKSLVTLLHLKYFNISYNRLRGEIPSSGPFTNFTYQSFMANEAFCGAPQLQVPPCKATAHRPRTKRVLLALYIFLPITSILLTLCLVFMLVNYRRRNKKVPIQGDDMLPTITHERISYHELLRATNSFNESNLLGTGSFGSVYKALLQEGKILAVKVFNLQLEGAFKSFDVECEILRNIRHRNLVKVISSCSNLDFKALVLEYMPNGSLEKWLYSHNYFLDMLQRLDIMTDVASALVYLHQGYSTPVVHCDLKPSNVLLDEDMVAHVSDFGISKLLGEGESIAQTKTLATIGYIAPEYGLEGTVSTRCDVYSYGIMLMETFTRTKPTNAMFTGDSSLKHWVNESLPNAIIQVIDHNLLVPENEHYDTKTQCASSVMELALKCSEELPQDRMNMTEVLAALKKIRLLFVAGCEKDLIHGGL